MKLPKAYNPGEYEADIYALWEKKRAFAPKHRGGKGYFSVSFPPPNANGALHMGQALTAAIQDSLIRYHRMTGKSTLFVPGADHAGFETWVVYERRLNQDGKSRFDYSREELYQQVWDFVQANKKNFEGQLRALGASFDWTRFTFTLDQNVVDTAYKTFEKMWHDKLIYRGKRVVNFCTFHGTSFSDIEVVHEAEDTKLWYIAYPLVSGEGEVVIATTRPETKLGQAALMVNPKDARYKHLIGQAVNQPLVPGQIIEIVGDEYVDMQFGTGVVTVTPAHDPNDFEVAQRHKLPALDLITPEGKMSQNVPEPFRGMTVMEARSAVEKALADGGYLRKTEPYHHSVAKCYKCGTIIEPLLREQWFINMRPLADRAVKELDKINFYPAGKKNQLKNYLTEVKDWNISRQIAWGIPIPAFQNTKDESDWIFDTRVNQEQIEVNGQTYRRDPDVFDTWFSSGHWPEVTLDYPDGEDFANFFPLSLMETGFDILFPWVSRMILISLYVTDRLPFKDVYLHGLVLAEDGKKKMSKSLGNVINPMDIIGQYGSDALRMGLLSGRRAGVNQAYHSAKVVGGRNFANKLWNVARFIEDKVGENYTGADTHKAASLADHWILSRAGETSRQTAAAMEKYRLSEAYELVYHFVWHDLADWYIEASKIETNPVLLAQLLETTLKLTHPFAPFVTETIWQTLGWQADSLLTTQAWPKPSTYEKTAAADFAKLVDIISQIRAINAAVGAKKPALYYRDSPLLSDNAELVSRLASLGSVSHVNGEGRGMRLVQAGLDVWLDIDIGAVRTYLDKLIDQRAAYLETMQRLEGRLANPGYADKAPAAIVEQTKQQLAEQKQLVEQISQEVETFTKLAEQQAA